MFNSFNSRFSERSRHYKKTLVASFEVISSTRQSVGGVLSRTSSVRVVDPIETFKGTNANDLSLENLVAIGADLKPTTARLDELAHAVNAERQIERAENFIASQTLKSE